MGGPNTGNILDPVNRAVRKVTDEDLDELGPAVLDFCTQ